MSKEPNLTIRDVVIFAMCTIVVVLALAQIVTL